MKSILETKKNKGGRPRIDATPIMVRVPPRLLAAIDAWADEQPTQPTRPDAIRRLVESGLSADRAGARNK